MASISFRDFELNQTTITGKRNPNVTVDAVRMRNKIDPETRQRTDEIEGTVVDIVARGKIQSVKLPLDTKATVEKIAEALKEHKIVTVNFGETASTLRGRCYAMYQNNQMIQGISCTATELNIVGIEDQEVEDFDDIIL